MRVMRAVIVVLVGLGVASCEQTKSANPLSPLAGPIAGVDITVPHLLKPETGEKFKPTQQPITLLFENATTTSVRPLYYTIEIASDSGFSNIVLQRTNITPGEGRTQYTLEGNLQIGRMYFWRARGEDGANAGGYSPVRSFEVQQFVVINAPEPVTPTGASQTNRRPTLTVNNASRSGPHGRLVYQFELSLDQSFAQRFWDGSTDEDGGQTRLQPPFDLAASTLHFWRARVHDGETFSPWSRVESFRTGAAPTPGPSQPPGGGSAACGPPYPSNGPQIVQCVANTYPERLAGGISLDERIRNMEFLRDRIIEVGICGGLDLAWNLKRGTGPHSVDALAWRTGGHVEVVDIGVGYDDTSRPLQLTWGIVEGPPGYDPYNPRPVCK